MYYNASATYMTMMSNSLPSPEYTGDSDSDTDIIHELEQKRRELDEEIARFRAQKDKEFKDFEAQLKAQKRQRSALSNSHFPKNNAPSYHVFTKNSPSATPPAPSMLNGCEKKVHSHQSRSSIRQSEPIRLIKPSNGPKVTPPTICLDKMNITGRSTAQSHVSPLQTLPTPTGASSFTGLSDARDAAASDGRHVTSDSVSINSDLDRDKPPRSPEPFKFLTPAYLPLLDSRHDREVRTIEGTQTEPASPVGPSIAIDAMTVHSTSLPTESSVPEAFQVPATKRAYTSPSAVHRVTLAPIIRNVNGRKRSSGKRKHVTFQLADRAIVEPSSSYEEGPSPDVDAGRRDSGDSNTSQDEHRPSVNPRNTPLDPFGRRKRALTPVDTPEEEIGMSMADLLLNGEDDDPSLNPSSPPRRSSTDDGYFSPHHTTSQSSTSPSPEKSAFFGLVDDNAYMSKRKTQLQSQKEERKLSGSNSSHSSPSISRQSSFDVSTSNYTSRAPDSSLQHKPVSPWQKQYPGTLEEDLLSDTNNVGFFELDEELSSPGGGQLKADPLDDEQGDEGGSRVQRDVDTVPDPSELQTGTSVPIDIVRRGSVTMTNSWIGTFGH